MPKIKRVLLIVLFSNLGIILGFFTLLHIFSYQWDRRAIDTSELKYYPHMDGSFTYEGSVEDFVALYQNPYSDDRTYVDFEYLGMQQTFEETDTWTLLYPGENGIDELNFQWRGLVIPASENDENYYTIIVRNRKLEKVYFFSPLRGLDCFFLPNEVREDEKYKEENKIREVRVVLGEEENGEKLYYYRVKFPETEKYSYEKNPKWGSELKKYDVLVEEKEIPAIYFYKVQEEGYVKAKRYAKGTLWYSSLDAMYFRQY